MWRFGFAQNRALPAGGKESETAAAQGQGDSPLISGRGAHAERCAREEQRLVAYADVGVLLRDSTRATTEVANVLEQDRAVRARPTPQPRLHQRLAPTSAVAYCSLANRLRCLSSEPSGEATPECPLP